MRSGNTSDIAGTASAPPESSITAESTMNGRTSVASAVMAPYATKARQFMRQAAALKKSAFTGGAECHAARGGANQNIIITGAYSSAAVAIALKKPPDCIVS